MRLIQCFLGFFLCFPLLAAESESSPYQIDFLNKWSAPFESSVSRTILYSGFGLSAFLYAERTKYGDPLQRNWSEDEPMGELAHFGDLMGQLVPNLLYIGGTHLAGESSRRNLMFDTTLYTGLTVTILKHLVGERRPHGGDTLSFPSGHTATAFAFAGVVGIEHEWYWGASAYGLASVVGASRINDNEHYLHDVVFGATLGLSYAYGLKALQAKSEKLQSSYIPLDGGGFFNVSYALDL